MRGTKRRSCTHTTPPVSAVTSNGSRAQADRPCHRSLRQVPCEKGRIQEGCLGVEPHIQLCSATPKHLQAAEKFDPADKLNVTEKVEVVGETTDKRCETCHHIYDEQQKKLIYKKDTENSCRGCHKAKDEKNARSMKKVAHSACIGCHMKLAEKVRKELLQEERTVLTERDKKRFGPFNCAGCHGEHKDLTPEDTEKDPRLVRGQKDVMDLALVESTPDNPVPAPTGRMKTVGYNHKAHEPRVQFCNTCHHHSLEKCSKCHTRQG